MIPSVIAGLETVQGQILEPSVAPFLSSPPAHFSQHPQQDRHMSPEYETIFDKISS